MTRVIVKQPLSDKAAKLAIDKAAKRVRVYKMLRHRGLNDKDARSLAGIV
jgi:hypothetical protein